MMQNITIKKSELCAMTLFILIIMETAFENTPLQIYNLMVNRIFLLVEIVIFILFLAMEKYSKKIFLMLMGALLFFVVSYFVLNAAILVKMFMVSMVVKRIGIQRAFEIIFKFKAIMLCIIIFMALVGIIPNEYEQIEKGIGSTYGYGLGYTHPNRLASALCCILLCYIGWKKDQLRWKNIFWIGIVTILGYFITKCRTLLYCMTLFLIFYILYKTKFTKKFTNKITSIIGIVSVPLCIATSVMIPTLLLSSAGKLQQIVYGINLLFSRRFTHVEHMFMTYPVTLFGGLFETSMMEEMFGYSVVDNGYIRFLYQYGIIGLAVFGVISVICFSKIMKKKEYIWKVIFIIIAIEGLLENIYIDISLNLIVIFWSELLSMKKKGKIKNYDS